MSVTTFSGVYFVYLVVVFFLPAERGSIKVWSLVACVAMPPSSQTDAQRICFFKSALVILVNNLCAFKLSMLLQAEESDNTIMPHLLTYLPSILATVSRHHVGALLGIVKYVCVEYIHYFAICASDTFATHCLAMSRHQHF